MQTLPGTWIHAGKEAHSHLHTQTVTDESLRRVKASRTSNGDNPGKVSNS